MRRTLGALLIAGLAGCLDLQSLQSGDGADMAMPGLDDLRQPDDLAVAADQRGPADLTMPADMTQAPYWTNVTPAATPPLNAVSGFASGGMSTVYAVGNAVALQTVVKKDTSGNYTKLATAPVSTANLTALWVKDAAEVWVLDDTAHAYQTTNGGTAFTDRGTATGITAGRGIFGRASDNVLAVGDDGMRVSQYVTAWTSYMTGFGAMVKLRGVWSSSDTFFVVGDGPLAARSTNPSGGSASWTTVGNPNGNPNILAVFGINNTNVWASTDKGQLLAINAGMTGWNELAGVGGSVSVQGVWGSAANDIWIVTGGGKVYQWTGAAPIVERTNNLTGTANLNLKGVWGDGAGNIWVVGTNGTAGFIFKH